jgi:hypothetical protein
MNKAAVGFWSNVCLFFAFISLAFTGAVMEWGFSHGGAGKGWQGGRGALEGAGEASSRFFLGIHKSEWGEIHFILALVLVSLVLVHLILHWNWIVCSVKNRIIGPTGH